MHEIPSLRDGSHSPEFTFPEDSDRPTVDYFGVNTPALFQFSAKKLTLHKDMKFRPGDEVSLRVPGTDTFEGYYVISHIEDGKYALEDQNHNIVNQGELFDEQDLILFEE